MVTFLQLSILLAAHSGDHSIQDYVQTNLRDFAVSAKVTACDQRELRKINKDYGQNYTFDRSNVKYKEPFKLRVESTVEDTTVTVTFNGPKLRIKAGVTSTQDLTNEPSRRQSALDFGILVPSLFTGFFNTHFVRVDRETGDPVFDVTYVDKTETAHYRIWVDTSHKVITKREWYGRYGGQLATFYYDHPVEVNGCWIPTVITVKNMDNRVAGSTRYDSIRVNQGLPDSVFAVGR